MELRRDPITQSWVFQDEGEAVEPQEGACPLCPGKEASVPRAVYSHPYGEWRWHVRVIPHLRPLYRVEGDPERRGKGIYDKMRSLGAHEIVIESPDHNQPLARQTDENIAQVLRAYVARITDLKKDRRLQYVTVSRNQGDLAGQDMQHPHSEITATMFIPRRVRYELESSKRYFDLKERCLLCDIVRQETTEQIRTVESSAGFVAFCPFASRVPYETWVLPVDHHSAIEEDLIVWDRQLELARLLGSVLRRLDLLAPAYHLVLHSSPNLTAKFEKAGIWQTLVEDYHWHFEILPVIPSKSKSYILKEVYYNSLPPEAAAEKLRNAGGSMHTEK
jgi:UDPglucose--hexose-1-phosphate uridylyltransferase